MNPPTPAIVTQLAARRLPRWVLLLLGLAYIVPGLLGRQPWRNADLASFGVMLDMARGSRDWWQPQVLGQAAEVQAWLPYWLGAFAIQGLPFLPADQAVRLPYGLLLLVTLVATWYAMYHLARLPAAQPVTFAFGGEARPTDYARALADAALLALIGSLGLALLAHESTPAAAQLASGAVLLYACARLASPHAERGWFSALMWWLGAAGLSLSGAPWLGMVLGAGWLTWAALWRHGPRLAHERRWMWLACVTGTLLAAVLAWKFDLSRLASPWTEPGAWLSLALWKEHGRLLMWFTWPAGPLALWTVWRWRRRLRSAHTLLPLWFVLAGLLSSWWLAASDRALLIALPGLACLAAFAMPTLTRTVTAWIDWFALLFFTGCSAIIWLYWIAMQTGVPERPSANVALILPGFTPAFSAWQFAPAMAATLVWMGLIAWRVGRHRPALWKGLVLSATGSTVCWLLLMTLWLPALNFGMGQEPISQRIAAVAPPDRCVLVHGLRQAQIAGLQYHGGLTLVRSGAGRGKDCGLLVVEPAAYPSLSEQVDMTPWALLARVPRLRETRDGLMVFERRR